MVPTVKAYPEATSRWDIGEKNSVRVRHRGYRSNILGRWGSWDHADPAAIVAHEVAYVRCEAHLFGVHVEALPAFAAACATVRVVEWTYPEAR